MSLQTLTCSDCKAEWQRVSARGRKPLKCPPCAEGRIRKPRTGRSSRLDIDALGYRLAKEITAKGSAIRAALGALRTGKVAEAEDILWKAQRER